MSVRGAAMRAGVIGLVAAGVISGATGDYGDAEDDTNIPISPPNWSFLVWVPIYLGAFVFAAAQALRPWRGDPAVARIRVSFAASVLLSGLWVRTARRPALEVAVVGATATTALIAQFRGARTTPSSPRERNRRRESARTWFFEVPVGLFAGWITLATVVATSQALVEKGLSALLRPRWSASLLLAAGAAGAVVTRRTRGVAYPLTLVWGLFGVAMKERSRTPVVARSAVAAGAAIATAVFNRPRE
ncbi:hypothetical protein HDC37_000955 [Microbacterium sp. AK009]|uniref:hypothetical protein n=1 Tax=Microbacterium sp. AK009 TaxID=2723068 RepID=UPI0015CAAA34|nr:hypothetical protein [Microbacterium sp. AK009]NYF16141.1 hypothetical protein [Microbacterium sp. AK009]